MIPLEAGDWVRSAIGGSMLLALPVAMLAGLVSFFSPCVLPLLPGYLSYATGLGASEIAQGSG
ncbi:MAG: cytochrome c biogenesis protein CcdA, partial [Propionicimonas sp.]